MLEALLDHASKRENTGLLALVSVEMTPQPAAM